MSIWLGLAVAALAAAGLTPAVGSPPSSAQQCPHGPPNVDYERIKTEYGEKQDTQRMWVLDWACVDQGAIILYDPLLAQRHAPEGKALPVIDVSKVEYYLRHASPLDIYTSMTRWGVDPRELLGVNATSVDGAAGSLLTSVYGSPGPYHNLVVRLPSSSELRSPRKREFSNCTVPVLIYTHW